MARWPPGRDTTSATWPAPVPCTRWAARTARPRFPANLLGDFGGGGMVMAYGVCAALVERATSGRGQVVDTAIVDGVASLLAMPLMLMAQGLWRDERGVNLLDGGVPWYDVYETADGQWMAVGALEPRFYAALLSGLGLPDAARPGRPAQLAGAARPVHGPVRRTDPGRVGRRPSPGPTRASNPCCRWPRPPPTST